MELDGTQHDDGYSLFRVFSLESADIYSKSIQSLIKMRTTRKRKINLQYVLKTVKVHETQVFSFLKSNILRKFLVQKYSSENHIFHIPCYNLSDFRVMIFLKYLLIGWSDVIFWWTVWSLADHLHPVYIDCKDPFITCNPHESFVHGYGFVVLANFLYFSSRKIFKTLLGMGC